MFSLICVWINDWTKNREAGDLRRCRAHYDVIVMCYGMQNKKSFHFEQYIHVLMYSKLQRGMHTHTHIKCVIIWSSYDSFCFNSNWTRVPYIESRIYLYIIGTPLVIKYWHVFLPFWVLLHVVWHCIVSGETNVSMPFRVSCKDTQSLERMIIIEQILKRSGIKKVIVLKQPGIILCS